MYKVIFAKMCKNSETGTSWRPIKDEKKRLTMIVRVCDHFIIIYCGTQDILLLFTAVWSAVIIICCSVMVRALYYIQIVVQAFYYYLLWCARHKTYCYYLSCRPVIVIIICCSVMVPDIVLYSNYNVGMRVFYYYLLWCARHAYYCDHVCM